MNAKEETALFKAQEEEAHQKRLRYLEKVKSGKLDRPAVDKSHPRYSQEADNKRVARMLGVKWDPRAERPIPSFESERPISSPVPAEEPAPEELLKPQPAMPDRRYTTAELDAMEEEAVRQGMSPEAARQASEELVGDVGRGEEFGTGVRSSIEKTIMGLKQAWQYLAGDDEGREAIQIALRKLEARPELQTPAGKLGEATGTALQFAVPQGVGTTVGRMAPKALVGPARKVLGAPTSTLRTAEQGAAFEAAQPVKVNDLSNEDFLQGKLGATALGFGTGAVTGKFANMLTSPGVPVAPERDAISQQAKRLGIVLTPAQRTGDITLSQFEEGLASRPGSAKIILEAREEQRKVLDKKAAEALGSKFDAPHEAALAEAHARAAQGYKPIASIPKMSWDTPYIEALDKFAASQATKAAGSVDAVRIAGNLKRAAGKHTGSDFLEDLQGVRDMSFGARQKGDVASAKQLSKLAEIMEDFAERRTALLAKKGLIPPDALDQLKAARKEYAKIHIIEKATEPVSGRVSPLKYLSNEFKRKPASRGPGTSDLDNELREVGEAARVLKQTTPYIGSSGTAERIAGQQLVEARTSGPLGAIRTSIPMAKNYLAAKYYMAHGGKPGFLGSRFTPEQNMYVRRLIPDVTFATKEGLNE